MLSTHPYLAGRPPRLFAHRGGGAEAPENSRAALEHTVRLGLTYMETDARATSDGVVVLHHDVTLDRTTDASGAIAAYSWTQLERVRDASGHPPLRLAEALAEFPALRFNVDAKSDDVVAPLLAIAREHPDRVGLASFSDARLAQARTLAPGVATSLGQGEITRLVGLSRLPLERAVALASRLLPRQAVAVQIPVRHRGVPVFTRRLVALAHRLDMEVHVWTVDDPAVAGRLLDAGADGIITDAPALMRLHFEDRGTWR